MTQRTIDAHHHVWNLSVRDQDWTRGPEFAPIRRNFTLEDLRPEATAAGVEGTVLVQTLTVREETPELLALAADSDLIAGVVGWTDLTAPDVPDALAELRELPGGDRLVGIRHQVQHEPDPDWLLRPDVTRGLAAVAAAGLTYDLLILPHQLPAAIETAARHPELKLAVNHLAKPPIASGEKTLWSHWSHHITELAAHPNTTCKLSGLVTEANWTHWTPSDLRPYTDTALQSFGPHRTMFGSDWPVCRLAATYTQVVATAHDLTDHLGAQERSEVFGGTAERVYGLERRADCQW